MLYTDIPKGQLVFKLSDMVRTKRMPPKLVMRPANTPIQPASSTKTGNSAHLKMSKRPAPVDKHEIGHQRPSKIVKLHFTQGQLERIGQSSIVVSRPPILSGGSQAPLSLSPSKLVLKQVDAPSAQPKMRVPLPTAARVPLPDSAPAAAFKKPSLKLKFSIGKKAA